MELVLPEQYVELEQEEMAYLDGGAYMSSSQCWNVCAAIAMSPGALMAAAATAAVITKITKWAKLAGGPVGIIVGFAAGYASAAVTKIAYGIGKGAASGSGLSLRWSWDPWNFGVQTYIGRASWA